MYPWWIQMKEAHMENINIEPKSSGIKLFNLLDVTDTLATAFLVTAMLVILALIIRIFFILVYCINYIFKWRRKQIHYNCAF